MELISRDCLASFLTLSGKLFCTSLCSLGSNSPNRVEGRGNATIHDVTETSKRPRKRFIDESPEDIDLATERTVLSEELERANTRLDALGNYLGQANAQYTSVQQFRDTLNLYEEEGEKLQRRIREIESELVRVRKARRNQSKPHRYRPACEASIGIFVPEAGTLEIILTYGAPSAFRNPVS